MEQNDRLRQIRKMLGLTQSELAEQIGIKTSTLSDIERGKIKTLTPRNIMLLSRIYNVNPRWLQSGEEPILLTEREKLDDLAEQNNLSEIEIEILRLYMRLPLESRMPLIKSLVAAVSKGGDKGKRKSRAKLDLDAELSLELSVAEGKKLYETQI